MDFRLRSLLRIFAADPTPENAQAFTFEYLRADPLPAILDKPLTIEQLFEQGTLDVESHLIELDVVIAVAFEDVFPPGWTENAYDYFFDRLSESVTDVSYLQEVSYEILSVGKGGVLHFGISGFIEIDSQSHFSIPQDVCLFCKESENIEDHPHGETEISIQCDNCDFTWVEDVVSGQKA